MKPSRAEAEALHVEIASFAAAGTRHGSSLWGTSSGCLICSLLRALNLTPAENGF
jgi:hypothetical protein